MYRILSFNRQNFHLADSLGMMAFGTKNSAVDGSGYSLGGTLVFI